MDNKCKKIGFIGLGVMGKPMAKNLLKAGFSLTVFDIKPEPVAELVALGAEKESSPSKVAGKCDIIITMLPNSPHVIQVLTGKDGVLEGIRPGSIIIDMSSISPVVAKKMYAAAAEKGVEMLDAPVSGGEPKAIDGTMSIMVALHLSAVSEAMVFAEKAGVDPEKVYQAIRGGLAASTVLDAKMPMILDRNFKPGGPIWMHTKDLLNVRDTALEIDAPIPLTTQILEAMKAMKADGHQNDDHCGIIQYWEKLANVTVKRR